MQKKDKKLYYAHLEYASTGQYEQVMKIAIMDQDLQSGDIGTLETPNCVHFYTLCV